MGGGLCGIARATSAGAGGDRHGLETGCRHSNARERRTAIDRIRLLIADEHPISREGLRALLAATTDMEVVAEAGSVPEFAQAVRLHRPDVVVLDLCVERHRIAEAVETARHADPRLRFVIFTTFRGPDEVAMALKSRMHGYVLKTDSPGDLLNAVRSVFRGGVWVSPALAWEQSEGLTPLSLTAREQEVLAAVASGKSNQEVAEALFIAEGTVKFHVNNILTKLGAADRTEAVVIGLQRGLLRLPIAV